MKRKILNIIRFFVGFFILFILFYRIGFKKIIITFKEINLFLLFISVIIYLIFFLIGSLNLKILVDSLTKRINFLKLTKYYFLSWSIGLLAPGKIGDFSLVYFLKKENIPLGRGIVIPLIDKLVTIIVLSILSIVGFFVFFTGMDALKLMVLLLIGFLVIVFFITDLGRTLIKKYILRKYSIKFKGFSKTFFYFLKKKKRILFLNFLLTITRVIITSMIYFVLFISLGQKINLIYIILINAIGTIIALIPITISGLGIREVTAVFLYNQIGVLNEITVTVYLTVTIFNYINAAINFLVLKME